MGMRSAAMVGGWVLAVAAATTAGWAGVSLIGDEVSPAGPPALSQAEVARRIQAASGTRTASVDAATAPAPATARPGGSDDPTPTTGPGDRGTSGGSSSTGTANGASTAASTADAPQRKPYTVRGGTVVLACTGDQITASTTPRLGYTVSKESGNGGTAITVEFQSSGSESKLVGQCSRGTPTATVEEKGPGGD